MKANRTPMLLALAVLAPGLALCVLQYRSLVELEAKTKDTARERLHDVLGASAHRVEARIQEIAGDALNPIAAPDPPPASELASRFAASRRSEPSIREAYLVSECACRGEPFDLFSSEERTAIHEPLGHEQMHRILHAFGGARPGGEGIQYYQAADSGSMVYAFRVLDPQHSLFAGLTIDARKLFEQMLAQSTTDPIGFSVADSEGRRIWASDPGTSGSEAEVRFGRLAPEWTLQGRYTGATIQTLAHRQFQRGAGLMALVVICLIMGTVMTVRAANREARAAALRSEFIANISHEMKTPLSLIRMFSETLELGRVSDPGKLASYYQTLHRESRKLTSLIENVLEFGRMEAGRREYRMAAGSVVDVVAEVMYSYEPQLRAGGFQWKTEIGTELPRVNLDPAALSQAVGNLVENAIKYSAERKAVEVAVFRREAEIAITVTDSGIGIPTGEQGRIFDRFYRASATLVHNTKGSGLGLAIVRHIVEAHGGQIRVDSVPGQGSRFTIALPAWAPAAVELPGVEACPRS